MILKYLKQPVDSMYQIYTNIDPGKLVAMSIWSDVFLVCNDKFENTSLF